MEGIPRREEIIKLFLCQFFSLYLTFGNTFVNREEHTKEPLPLIQGENGWKSPQPHPASINNLTKHNSYNLLTVPLSRLLSHTSSFPR